LAIAEVKSSVGRAQRGSHLPAGVISVVNWDKN